MVKKHYEPYKNRNDWIFFPIHLVVLLVTILMITVSQSTVCQGQISRWLLVTGSIFLTQYGVELMVKSCCLRENEDGSDDMNPDFLIWTLFTLPCYTLAALALQIGLLIWGLVVFTNERAICTANNANNFVLAVVILGSCFVFFKLLLVVCFCTISKGDFKKAQMEAKKEAIRNGM